MYFPGFSTYSRNSICSFTRMTNLGGFAWGVLSTNYPPWQSVGRTSGSPLLLLEDRMRVTRHQTGPINDRRPHLSKPTKDFTILLPAIVRQRQLVWLLCSLSVRCSLFSVQPLLRKAESLYNRCSLQATVPNREFNCSLPIR